MASCNKSHKAKRQRKSIYPWQSHKILTGHNILYHFRSTLKHLELMLQHVGVECGAVFLLCMSQSIYHGASKLHNGMECFHEISVALCLRVYPFSPSAKVLHPACHLCAALPAQLPRLLLVIFAPIFPDFHCRSCLVLFLSWSLSAMRRW